jgi:hypothetical protein
VLKKDNHVTNPQKSSIVPNINAKLSSIKLKKKISDIVILLVDAIQS